MRKAKQNFVLFLFNFTRLAHGIFFGATKVEILNLMKTEHANETEVIAKPIQKWSKLNIFNIQIFCRNRITGNLQLMHLKNEIK